MGGFANVMNITFLKKKKRTKIINAGFHLGEESKKTALNQKSMELKIKQWKKKIKSLFSERIRKTDKSRKKEKTLIIISGV